MKCHSATERSAFSHEIASGWRLSRRHEDLDCDSCHPDGQRLSSKVMSCTNCHDDWNANNLEHAKTGLELDEIHVDADCSDCHINQKYDTD